LESTYKHFPQTEIQILEDFISYCAIGAGERKQKDIRRIIIQFRDIVEKDLAKITLRDLRGFLALLNQSGRKEYTKNGIKAHVRRFLKWRFKDWSQRFEEFRDIKLKKAFNEEKINEGTLLKPAQIETIVKKETDLIRKAFFVTLYESGARPQELRLLKWKNVHLDSDRGLSELHLFANKTSRARTVLVKDATLYLKQLFENRSSEYVFPSPENDNQPLPKTTSFRWIHEMGQSAGLKIFPYLLRHTRAHELYSKLPSKVAQKFMGHNSDMSDLYAHISSRDIKDSMLKTVYNFQELPEEKKHKLEIEMESLRREMEILRKKVIALIVDRKPSIKDVEAALHKRRSL
jgi:integrase